MKRKYSIDKLSSVVFDIERIAEKTQAFCDQKEIYAFDNNIRRDIRDHFINLRGHLYWRYKLNVIEGPVPF